MRADWQPRLLLDQNVPYGLIFRLRSLFQDAYPVEHIFDLGMATASDLEVFDWAQRAEAIIVTFDEDFADQRVFPVGSHAGIIRLRVEPTTEDVAFVALDRPFAEFELKDLFRKLVIVDNTRVRIRS